jgi:hypothetical protein
MGGRRETPEHRKSQMDRAGLGVVEHAKTHRMKGIGEANHSWNSDQTSAMPAISLAMNPPAWRPPVSASAISLSSSS